MDLIVISTRQLQHSILSGLLNVPKCAAIEEHSSSESPSESEGCVPTCFAAAASFPIYLSGGTATGKSSLCKHVLGSSGVRHAIFDAGLQLHEEALFYQTVLMGLRGQSFCAANGFDFPESLPRCTSFAAFLQQLESLLQSEPLRCFCVAIDDFHLMVDGRRFSQRFLSCLLRLGELLPPSCACRLSLLLIGEPTWTSLSLRAAPVAPLSIHFPPYSLEDCTTIVLAHHAVQERTRAAPDLSSLASAEQMARLKRQLVSLLWQESRHRCVRSVRDLYRLFSVYWPRFVAPILKGIVDPAGPRVGDALASRLSTKSSVTGKRLSYLAPKLFDRIYLGESNSLDDLDAHLLDATSATHSIQHLPLVSKLLLVACYLASHIKSDLDQRLFGAEPSSASSVKRRHHAAAGSSSASRRGVSEVSVPSNFPTERMLEIFKHLLKDIDATIKVDAIGVYEQIATLVKLNYLIRTSNYHNITAQKLRSNITKEDVLRIASTIPNFDLSPYFL